MSALSHREPAVAGLFYPGSGAVLGRDVAALLDGAAARRAPVAGELAPKALIVPHAGYIYSGPVAAAAYAELRATQAGWRRIVLIGPSHRVGFRGVAVPTVDLFDTPLGPVTIDDAARSQALAHPAVIASDRAHAREHSLEVQLPFLLAVLGEFSLLPLLAGEASAEIVAEVLEQLWGGPETGMLISTDLSHFHDAATARRLDRVTADRILSFDTTLNGEDACGCVGLNGFLLAARRHGLRVHELAVANSGDTAGDGDRVVGYGAFVFHAGGPPHA